MPGLLERFGEALMTVSEDCKLVTDWMREPDHAEKFTFNSLNDWLDRRPIAEVARLTAALSDQAGRWMDISTAPKDGKVDLLYPYPRGRTKDCEWRQGGIYGDGGWYWSRPTWTSDLSDHKLLPESEWQTGSYQNMQPTHWMRPPAPPPSSTAGESQSG